MNGNEALPASDPVRETFTLNRALEYFSESDLTKQIGQPRHRWAEALLKELIDNALDACEQADVPPEIIVRVADDYLEVADNGPGIPAATVAKSLDYSVRVTSNALYCSPSRGQLGNALKCLWAAPFVVSGQQTTRVEIEAHGIKHCVEVSLDRIAQTPRLVHREEPSVVQIGTIVRLYWPQVAGSLSRVAGGDLYKAAHLLRNYHVFNPHAAFHLQAEGQDSSTYAATLPTWRKWRTCDPTSPHWYDPERFRELVAGYVRLDQHSSRRRSVRDFAATFDGLAQTAKQKKVTEAAGLSRALLTDLVDGADLDQDKLARLLGAMQVASRPVAPDRLGVLGKPYLLDCLVRLTASPDSVRYHCRKGVADGKPFVVEVALGIADDPTDDGTEIIGLNFSPAVGRLTEDLSEALAYARINSSDPVVLVCHLTQPALEYVDRGKTRLSLLPDVRDALRECVDKAGKRWREAKRRADREGRLQQRDYERLRKASKPQTLSLKDAACQVMEQAYLQASGDKRYPAHGRQIMYAARPRVLALTGGKCWSHSNYFIQKLLIRFLREHPQLTADWDVVFDDRGHFIEPHTSMRIGLGTLSVRDYRNKWCAQMAAPEARVHVLYRAKTCGPDCRFRFALFVEKEGFWPLLEQQHLAERYDLALMSTKGMSVTAARQLVEHLSARGVTILVLHDFDKAGFSILHTLGHDTERFQFRVKPTVIDLGLRLPDAQALGLASEPVEYPRSKQETDPRSNLRKCGATPEEVDFLVRGRRGNGWSGERIELNALTSPQFIAFLEQKLNEHGVAQKVVPEPSALADAWRQAVRMARLEDAMQRAQVDLDRLPMDAVPDGLQDALCQEITGTIGCWDAALARLAQQFVAGTKASGG